MSSDPRTTPSFAITYDEAPSETLLAGFSAFGLAGLTAVDCLVDQLEPEEVGRVWWGRDDQGSRTPSSVTTWSTSRVGVAS